MSVRNIFFPQWSTPITLVGHVVVHYAENQKDAIHVKLSHVSLVLCHNFFFFFNTILSQSQLIHT